MRFELFVLMYMKSVRKKEKETRGFLKNICIQHILLMGYGIEHMVPLDNENRNIQQCMLLKGPTTIYYIRVLQLYTIQGFSTNILYKGSITICYTRVL